MKKYKHHLSQGPNGTIYEEIYSDPKGSLVSYPAIGVISGGRVWIDKKDLETYYEEYKEPRKLERWFNVYERDDGSLSTGGMFSTKECAVENAKAVSRSSELVKTIKIEEMI